MNDDLCFSITVSSNLHKYTYMYVCLKLHPSTYKHKEEGTLQSSNSHSGNLKIHASKSHWPDMHGSSKIMHSEKIQFNVTATFSWQHVTKSKCSDSKLLRVNGVFEATIYPVWSILITLTNTNNMA